MRKLIFIFLSICVLNSCLGMQEVEPVSGIPQFEEFSYVSLGGGSYELTASLTSPDACVAECGFIVDKQKRIVEGHSSLRDLETYSSVLKKNTFWAEVDLRKHISTRSIAEVWCCSYVSNGRDVILSSWQQIRYESKDDDYSSGESVNLSADETANSYIVSEPGVYRFKAVKGNSSQLISNTSSADVLWESFGTSEEPSAGDLVRNVRLEDGEIYFRVPSAFREGNAVIAAKDASGKILWSWHIWLTDEPQECVYANGAGTMMDRNLGATSVNPGDVGTLGLMYQWGRKDPFLGSSEIRDSVDAASTYVWPAPVTSDSQNGTIEYAVQHPTTFILQNTLNVDWFYTGTSASDQTRWQYEKTIYDPCPAGWQIPTGGESGIWNIAGFSGDMLQGQLEITGAGVVINPGFSNPSTFYPTPGNRYRADGGLGNVGRTGYYWALGLASNGCSGYGFWVTESGYMNATYYSGRANGQSVRCMRVGSASAPEEKEPAEVTIADFLMAAESQDDWYVLSGEIQNITSTIYGDFDLVDQTGSIYVYGLTASKVAANDKSFSSLGLKEGDNVTIIGQRGSYNGSPQVLNAYYVSHESASDASVWGIVGDVTGWGSSPDIVLQKTDTDGLFVAYRVEMPAGGFKIRANNEWNDAANYGLEHEATVEVDNAYELICGVGSFAMTIAAGTYDIWFDLKNSMIFIMTPGKTPDQAGAGDVVAPSTYDWYLVGNFNGWVTVDAAYKMTKEGDWYVFKGFTADGMGIKFVADPGWSVNRGGSFVAANQAIAVMHDGVDMMVTAGSYDVYLNADATVSYFMEVGNTPDQAGAEEKPGVKVVRYSLTFPEGGNAEEKYACENNAGFYVQTTGGWVVDANSQKFAVPGASEYDSYATRLKGSKTSDTKSMTITVPNDGKLYIAARSANSSAADRTMALMQGDKEILAPTVIQDADKFTAGDALVFPYVVVDVKAGDIQVILNNGINFYGIVYDALEGGPAGVDYVWDFSAPEWVDAMTGSGIAANTNDSNWNLEVNGLKVIAGGGSIKWNFSGETYFWQPGGAGTDAKRYFEFTTDVAGKLTVYASNTGSSEDLIRMVTVKVGDGEPESLPGGYSSSDLGHAVDFNITAGTVKIYPTGNGLRFYKIEFHSN